MLNVVLTCVCITNNSKLSAVQMYETCATYEPAFSVFVYSVIKYSTIFIVCDASVVHFA